MSTFASIILSEFICLSLPCQVRKERKEAAARKKAEKEAAGVEDLSSCFFPCASLPAATRMPTLRGPGYPRQNCKC